jgi:hypothetical protein
MKYFSFNNNHSEINCDENYELVQIDINTGLYRIQYVIFSDNFIKLIDELEIAEVVDGNILWDEYIEDDGETIRFQQHSLSLFDFINNYITIYDLRKIINYINYHTENLTHTITNKN